MGQAFKGDLGSGNPTLADCCPCVHEPHSCWRERGVGCGGRKTEEEEGGGGGGSN